MFKVLHIISLFAVFWSSAVICDVCLSTTQTWGSDDPNVFFYCDPTTNQSASASCADGTGYVKNATVGGCIPWDEWSDSCVNKTDPSTITCEGTSAQRPTGTSNPGVYLLCPESGATVVELNCPEGRGFYSGNKYLGCFPWTLWRNLTGCVNEN